MVNLKRTIGMLQAKRKELLSHLAAVDRAIAALDGAGGDIPGTAEQSGREAPAERAPGEVVATRVKAKRVLSDAHKQAMIVGRRKARETKDVAVGLAREMPAEGFVPAIAKGIVGDAPRLVKRQRKLVVEPAAGEAARKETFIN